MDWLDVLDDRTGRGNLARRTPGETEQQRRQRLEDAARLQEQHIVSSIRARDPGLDLGAAVGAARNAFLIVKRAENLGRSDMARQAMTEAGWQEFRASESNYQLQGQRFVTTELMVETVRVVEAHTTAGVGQIVLDIWASGDDQLVDLATGLPLPDSSGQREWVERVSFRRDVDPGSAAPSCPNCGSPLHVTADGHCSFCQALPPGAASAWLIEHRERLSLEDALSQESSSFGVAVPGASGAGPVAPIQPDPTVASGVAAIRERDPGFGDRALVVEVRGAFLLIDRAYTEVNPLACRAMVADAEWQVIAGEIDTLRAAGERRVHGSLEIAGAGIISVATDGGRDRVTVRLQLRSTRCRLRLGSDLVSAGDDRAVVAWATDVVAERDASVRSNPLAGFVVNTCPACAASLAVDEAGGCRTCGRHLTGGDLDWVISQVTEVAS